ncbi:MAG: fasciclin domain-containing protein [Gemmatimonadota bacterium]|nr:fasciclin domain-containing protein [Gemmatimonadota bacterium]MDE3004965.1 fasciclin domain-containing protein [Gemmatimonadota bacterium]MDE3014356.1 fasciclin domain-containing protein [Gemmatimonadota bacterium]
MLRIKSIRIAGVLLAAIGLAACEEEATTVIPEQPVSIAATAAGTSGLSALVSALQAADLVTTLEGTGPFTVFAPLNSAFGALDPAVLDGLLQTGNVDLLTRVLTFHVVAGAAAASTDLSDGQSFTTVEGGTLTIGVSAGGGVTVNGANVVSADIEASNGVVHFIDAVLLPEGFNAYETAVLTGTTTTLASAVLAAELDDDLSGTGPFTIFAPTNEAFAALSTVPSGQALTDVLTYHVLDSEVASGDLSDGLQVTNTLLAGGVFTVNISGSDVTITDGSGNTVNVIITDVPASNGIIHVIDAVLIPTP